MKKGKHMTWCEEIEDWLENTYGPWYAAWLASQGEGPVPNSGGQGDPPPPPKKV